MIIAAAVRATASGLLARMELVLPVKMVIANQISRYLTMELLQTVVARQVMLLQILIMANFIAQTHHLRVNFGGWEIRKYSAIDQTNWHQRVIVDFTRKVMAILRIENHLLWIV